jgi:hypothetical protein
MLAEIAADQASGALFMSPRLSAAGLSEYPGLLCEAVESHNDGWLTNTLNSGGRLNATEQRRTKNGVTMVKVPYTAAETLAEGEFNRFYCRGLCRAVLESDPVAELEVYRAKAVANPRPESERLIGKKVKAAALLADLRTSIGVDTALGIPAGPNSGLSVRIPKATPTPVA